MSDFFRKDNNVDVTEDGSDLFADLKPSSIVPGYELYDRGILFLQEALEITIREDPFKITGHQLYKISKPTNLKGIKYPDKFFITKKPNKDELKEIQSKLIDLLNNGSDSKYFTTKIKPPAGATHAQMISSLICLILPEFESKTLAESLKLNDQLVDIELDGSKKVHELGIEINPSDTLDLSSSKWPISYIPKKEWFDNKIKNIKPEDVFTLHEGQELKLFCLALGRLLIGCNGNIQSQSRKKINHSWRTMIINLGRYPGMGKSTLIDYIIKAISLVGYKTSNFETIKGQFGLASIIDSHLSYCPDFNEKSLKDFISAPLFKPLITNEKVRVEEKFVKATECTAKSLFIANINKFNTSVLYSADDGAINRLAILETRSPQELRDFRDSLTEDQASFGSPDLSPFLHIPWLSEKFNVESHTIILWVLRQCVDLFYKHLENETLIDYSKELKRSLQINLPENYDRTLCELLQLCWLMRTNNTFIPELNGKLLGESIQALNYVINDTRAHKVRNLIKQDWINTGKNNDHPWISLKTLDIWSVASAVNVYLGGIETYNKHFHQCVKTIFGELSLSSGFKFSPNVVNTKDSWTESRRTLSRTLKLAKFILEKNVDDTLIDLGSPECKPDISHIYEANFDRERVAKQRNGDI